MKWPGVVLEMSSKDGKQAENLDAEERQAEHVGCRG